MPLLPGYAHRSAQEIDARIGIIWKPSGPHITYEVSGFRANMRDVLDASDMTSVTAQETANGSIEVILQKGDLMAVTFQDANFQAQNVKTKEDVVEVLLMVMMYSSDRYKEIDKTPQR